MKTYLFDTINRYKRFSEELDAKTIICNKAWLIFNDSGEREVYIFNTDGTLIISVSGRVTNATWQYVSANKSLIISGNNQSYMVRPAFYDNQIFALQVDGTSEYAFLIDENNLPSTTIRTLSDLKEHFAEKERQALLEEQRREQAEADVLKQQQLEAEREKQRLAEKAKDAELQKRAEEIKGKIQTPYLLKSLVPIFIFIFVFPLGASFYSNGTVIANVAFIIMVTLFINAVVQMSSINSKLEKWKKEHPDDPVCKFL